MFSAHMQEVNLKVVWFSIYFTYVSVSGMMYAQEISASRYVELCLGMVLSKHHLKTHMHTILSQNVTNNFLLLATRSSHTIF